MDEDFRTLPSLIRTHAQARPAHAALVQADDRLSYAALDGLMDRIAAALQRDGVQPGDAVAVCAGTSTRYAALFLGALRAGAVVAPLAPSSTAASLAAMLADAQPRALFVDAAAAALIAPSELPRIALDDDAAFERWLAPAGTSFNEPPLPPEAPFNIIYSSGTTGVPKGIVQSHGMRWAHVQRSRQFGYAPDGITLLATPLYSNTTLVVFFPTLASGGCVVLMPKFDAADYLALAERHRATHTMLVPVQYQRLMALPGFERHELRSFIHKFCTSAPFSAALKADVLARWPGGLVEFYGMTEGGGTCILAAHEHPDKLHTVGCPAEGHDIRLIDDDGRELPPGATGEVVGHSPGMMLGYHRQPQKTREAEWFDAAGRRFIRTGDVGRFDADGFLVLLDRKKDLVISGGFNIYPSDLEAVLREHPAVADAAVVGVPSTEWGETPVAFVVLRADAAAGTDAEVLKQWLNARVGKTQRLAGVTLIDELPRSAIGKVLKRELRERWR
ncbi:MULTISPECIES: class I adenylate-forming enzyme family protein [unclassified Rhizobacter]|uniref:class I adenylate-forming enzyme family protein n=1 Tax=unclassified Rhizobacter TaxID=2640088 RepID=UPI0006F98A38|nr:MULTISPECIES: class I adenylate-forming enzyme family protein [unclassified Rhizobacter]KQU78385.1 4-coumarate--CoA ligase [Rhizobacter sp. Root29]KQW10905.1 4-coumarate--CoA ligase [Rhizobacter sp. Root1238]KRB25251.1 4-coumarate--CoA ligase [Rhizobacter sp. Root16D2]